MSVVYLWVFKSKCGSLFGGFFCFGGRYFLVLGLYEIFFLLFVFFLIVKFYV